MNKSLLGNTRIEHPKQTNITHFSLLFNEVKKSTSCKVIYAKPGTIFMVRSSNVPFGDHFIIITGPPVIKSSGLRPRVITVKYSNESLKRLLDDHDDGFPVLLELNEFAQNMFYNFLDQQPLNLRSYECSTIN